MAPKLLSVIRVLVLSLTLCLTTIATSALAASPSAAPPIKQHIIKFYLDPALVPDLEFAKTVLPKYVSDLNIILAKNTNRQLVFDPETDIILTSTKPQTDSATPPLPTEGFEIWVYATHTSNAASYGGYAGMDASGAGVLAGLYWTKLYDPDNPRPSDIQDYSLQLYYMLHELAHVFGAGIGEYYNLAQITDTTNTAPLLNINIDDSTDGFWSDKTDFFADPLMRFTSTSIRSAYLGAVRYSNLTAAVISGDYRNGIPSFDHYTVQVSDTNGQPVTSAEIKVWNVKGASPYASQLLFDGPTDANGQVVLPWGGIGDPHNTNNFLRLIKVYKNGLAIAKPKYVSIFDADIAKLVNGDSSYSVSIVANNPPTDISLSSNSIGQHQPLNTLVGTLATTDANADASFTYSFCGGADDTSFKISGNNLISAAVFDYATKNDYNICIQTINQDGSVFQKPFTITIINLFSATFNPSGAYNGWALEFKAGNNLGGSVNNSGTSLIVGDDALNRQYKSILSFNTTALPDNAVITGITLKIQAIGSTRK